MSTYNVVAASNESTVVTEYEPQKANALTPTRARLRWSRHLSGCWRSKAMPSSLSMRTLTLW